WPRTCSSIPLRRHVGATTWRKNREGMAVHRWRLYAMALLGGAALIGLGVAPVPGQDAPGQRTAPAAWASSGNETPAPAGPPAAPPPRRHTPPPPPPRAPPPPGPPGGGGRPGNPHPPPPPPPPTQQPPPPHPIPPPPSPAQPVNHVVPATTREPTTGSALTVDV